MNEFLQSLRSNANKNRSYNRNRKQYDGNNGGGHYNGGGGSNKGHYNGGGGNGGHYGGYDKRNSGSRGNYVSHDYAQQQMAPVEESFDMAAVAESIMKTMEHIASASEKRAEAESRKADALESIAAYLQSTGEFPAFSGQPSPAEAPMEEVHEDAIHQEMMDAPQEIETVEEVVEAPVKKAKTRGRKKKAVAKAPEKKTVVKRKKKDVDAGIRDQVMLIIEKMRDEGATYNMIAQRLIDEDIPTFSGKGQWHAQTIHRLCQSFK